LENNILSFYKKGVEFKPSYFSNMQCKRICGVADAALAIDHIEEHYAAVGFTERLAEFTRFLIQRFGWKCDALAESMPDSQRYKELVCDEFREIVCSTNREDMRLFDSMSSRFI